MITELLRTYMIRVVNFLDRELGLGRLITVHSPYRGLVGQEYFMKIRGT